MNIAYGICGDGRGHFGRSYALIEKLRSREHEVDVFTFGDAYEMFQKIGYPEGKLHEIQGLRFGIENCTAIIEYEDGSMELMDYSILQHQQVMRNLSQ